MEKIETESLTKKTNKQALKGERALVLDLDL